MAITSPALTLAMDAMFGNIKPVIDALKKLGATDFSADAPGFQVKPGATIKIPVSSIEAASEYNDTSNNYLTGGNTDWATLTATHYLKGFDVSGVNVDQGCDAQKMKQLFTARAGAGIAAAVQANIKSALDGATASTGLTLKAITSSDGPTIDEYLALGDTATWLNKSTSMLALNGTLLANIKKVFAAQHIIGTPDELAQYMGFAGCVLVPGLTARAAIVPAGSMGFLGRVPAIIARFMEAGAQMDEDTGLSVGIVLADDQAHNRLVANADLWFGSALMSAPANAETAGVIKIA